jgi:hypothetical protein
MCDYSLHAVASRPAKVGEALITTTFRGTSTRGFASESEPGVAVCLLPGTELAFDEEVTVAKHWMFATSTGFRVARFCAVEPDEPHRHHDALAFPDGKTILVTMLTARQRASVLQLPVVRLESDAHLPAEEIATRQSRPARALNSAV